MLNFNENLIAKNVAPHYGELVRIVKKAHSDFLKFPAMDGINYSGVPYAWIMLRKIENLLAQSYIITQGYGVIEPYYGTFLLNIQGIKISFNKVDSRKRKCKDVLIPYEANFSDSYLRQGSLFADSSIFNDKPISDKSPLTIGYMLRLMDISNVFVTHQLGKTVHWHEKITDCVPSTVLMNKKPNQTVENSKKRRVKSHTDKSKKVVYLRDN